MSQTILHHCGKATSTSPKRQQGEPVPCSRGGLVMRWGLLLLIAGYLLFAHLGCHGEDNELFAIVRYAVPGMGQKSSPTKP